MAASKITKEYLASSLKELLKERPLAKISVKDITEHSGMSRNSFYYHFQDKYELINWVFYSDISGNESLFKHPSKLAENFISICKCLYNNREFYLACFQYAGQNSLFETLYQIYYRLWKDNLSMRYTMLGTCLSEEELDLMARLDAHAFVGITADWVKDGMRNNYMEYFRKISSFIDIEEGTDIEEYYEMVS